MSAVEEKIIQRIKQLIEKGERAKSVYIPGPPHSIGLGHLDYSLFNEWKSGAENLIIRVTGKDSNYYNNFVEEAQNAWAQCVESGIGILQALKEDIETGSLIAIRQLVISEVFSDFLDIARHLLDVGYKDPAASLTGAVLEDGLRKIALKNDVNVKNSDDIGSLNTKLAQKDVYNHLMQKQIQAWKAVRDSADHAKFNEYKKEDVEDMLRGVQRFLSENL